MSDFEIHEGEQLVDSAVDMTIKKIGRGGYSIVAMGPDRLQQGDWVALKTLRPEYLTKPAKKERFVQESLIWVGLWDHPNILNAQFVSQINGVPFLHLDYAEKGSLRETLERDPTIPFDTRLWWAQQVAQGIAYLHRADTNPTLDSVLHARPIIHRDLKPDNILVLGNNIVQISDLGMSRVITADVASKPDAREPLSDATMIYTYKSATRWGSGTPPYMAPEMWLNPEEMSTSTDMYAFGLILAELFTGEHALMDLNRRHSLNEWANAHLYSQPQSLRKKVPNLPGSIEGLYQNCVNKDAAKRPTAREAGKVLATAAHDAHAPVYFVIESTPQSDPLNVHFFWHNRASAYEMFDHHNDAFACIERALALDPTAYYALREKANILNSLGRTKEALLMQIQLAARREPQESRVPKRLQRRSEIFHQQNRRSALAEEQRSISIFSMLELRSQHDLSHQQQLNLVNIVEIPNVNAGMEMSNPQPISDSEVINARGSALGDVPIDPSYAPLEHDYPEFMRQGQRHTGLALHLTDYAFIDVTVAREAHGGMGRVYMGPDHRFNQGEWLALKTLHPKYLATARGQQLFLSECLTWVGLWPHANLLTAHGVTEINSQLFLVLDYAERGSLRDLLQGHAAKQQGQPLPIDAAMELAQQIAAGLVALHTPDPNHLRDQPLVHRDLKPENILLDQSGYALITDFGLAKVIAALATTPSPTTTTATTPKVLDEAEAESAETDERTERTAEAAEADAQATQSRRYHTQRGVAMGTLPYMAPEQWVDAATAGPPADLYAFGLILGELLTGTHPLLPWGQGGYSADEEQWRLAHFQAPPPSLEELRTEIRHAAGATAAEPLLPEDLEILFRQLLAKREEERPTAAETLSVLQQIAVTLGEEPYRPPERVSHTPDNERIKWHNWAISYFKFGLYPEALVRNDRALALSPTNGNVLLNRGTILAELGRLEEALTCYDRALASYPDTDSFHRAGVWSQRANRLSDAGRYAEAEAAYAQAVALAPEDPGYWSNRANNERLCGLAVAAVGQQAEAEQHWRQGLDYAEQAVHLNPNNPNSTRLRDMLLQTLGGR